MYDDFWLGSGRLAVLADWMAVVDYSARDRWMAELHVMRVYVHVRHGSCDVREQN